MARRSLSNPPDAFLFAPLRPSRTLFRFRIFLQTFVIFVPCFRLLSSTTRSNDPNPEARPSHLSIASSVQRSLSHGPNDLSPCEPSPKPLLFCLFLFFFWSVVYVLCRVLSIYPLVFLDGRMTTVVVACRGVSGLCFIIRAPSHASVICQTLLLSHTTRPCGLDPHSRCCRVRARSRRARVMDDLTPWRHRLRSSYCHSSSSSTFNPYSIAFRS